MENRNTSDSIEAYLKKILEESNEVEIRRSELAEFFNCVPSQINYVINTRFTLHQGYHVESKRGGGGYIRIIRLRLTKKHEYLQNLKKQLKNKLTVKEGQQLIQYLYSENLITKQEGNLMLSAISVKTLGDFPQADAIRGALLRAFLERLSYAIKE